MSDETEKPTLDEVKAELKTTGYNSIAKILKYLASYYGGYFPDDYMMNREFLKILTGLVGEMLAHFPEDQIDEVTDEAYKNIAYNQDMTESELATIAARTVAPSEVQEIKKYDLTKMKPQGNC